MTVHRTVTFFSYMAGHLIFSEHDTVKLAGKYETPLYVLSQDKIEENIKTLKKALRECKVAYEISYAGKAFLNIAIARLMGNLGIGLDCCSGGELYTAKRAGFNPARITLHGSNKTEAELKEALKYGVGKICVDSLTELKLLDRVAKQQQKHVDILVRINPGVDGHTNEKINTGKADTKFGIPLSQKDELIKVLKRADNLRLVGLHFHVGSQILSEKPYIEAINKVMGLYKELKQRGFKDLYILNIGGGFGINYKFADEKFRPEEVFPKIIGHLKSVCEKLELRCPLVSIEPGRFIIGDAGITLYTVGTIKETDDKTFLIVDGGMGDNPRPALYKAEYEAAICNRPLTKRNAKEVKISGRACETDTLIEKVKLAAPQEGDILAVLKTGAYNYSMASHYNRYPKPAVVLLNGENDSLITERENYQDLIRQDKLPVWL